MKIKKVGIVALSCQIKDSNRNKGVEKSLEILRQKGVAIEFGDSYLDYKDQFVASTSSRVNDIHKFFEDTNVDFIMNLTGGYNCNEILDQLDYDLIRKNPKPFVGYSDITAINLALFCKSGVETINGPMLVDSAFDDKAIERLLEFFESENKEFENFESYYTSYKSKSFLSLTIKLIEGKKLTCEGNIIVGNLSTFNLLLGTEYVPDLTNKILFLEYDKEESKALPSIQRMLWQIRQNGVFDKIDGLVFGLLEPEVQSEESELNLSIKKILEDVTAGFNFPVLYNLQFGHIYPSLILQNGSKIKIENSKIRLL